MKKNFNIEDSNKSGVYKITNMAKDGMEVLTIYRYQADIIENTLRLVSNLQHSSANETCLDRDITQSWQITKNVIAKEIDKPTFESRFRK